jgi:hypothetical protein
MWSTLEPLSLVACTISHRLIGVNERQGNNLTQERRDGRKGKIEKGPRVILRYHEIAVSRLPFRHSSIPTSNLRLPCQLRDSTAQMK